VKRFEEIAKNNSTLTLEAVAERVGLRVATTEMVPGRFYSLSVLPPILNPTPEAVSAYTKGKGYLDLNPTGLMFFHPDWVENRLVLLLNLKVMPPAASARLLEAYYAAASRAGFDRLYAEKGELKPLNERRGLDLPFYLITPTQLSQIVGVDNLNYAINKYRIDEIADARLIDWDQFGMLVRPQVSTRGLFPEPINLERLYTDFIENSIS
jgi:hypothetical protein